MCYKQKRLVLRIGQFFIRFQHRYKIAARLFYPVNIPVYFVFVQYFVYIAYGFYFLGLGLGGVNLYQVYKMVFGRLVQRVEIQLLGV